MANLAVATEQVVNYNNVIQFVPIKKAKKHNDGGVKTPDNTGKDTEVYAFKTREEIASMITVLDKHIVEATNKHHKQLASRNKMLFIIGINVGIRASDLRTLKWSFFFEKQNDGSLKFKDSYKFMPMKTRKHKKFVKINFNKAVQQVIYDYIAEYPIEDLNDYLFASRRGDDPITVGALRKVIKETAYEAGIDQNVGSHSLRKTFGFWCWHEAEDKNKALVILQQIFNHSSTQTTAKYIGILDDEIKDMFDSIDLGLDMI